ncbi:MAG: hypothetical protein LRZ88_07080 [Candidatus Cloacimonetes bacterium]|nr:hypothetical protein [Candidatus Cloacimonadota bacterium]
MYYTDQKLEKLAFTHLPDNFEVSSADAVKGFFEELLARKAASANGFETEPGSMV